MYYHCVELWKPYSIDVFDQFRRFNCFNGDNSDDESKSNQKPNFKPKMPDGSKSRNATSMPSAAANIFEPSQELKLPFKVVDEKLFSARSQRLKQEQATVLLSSNGDINELQILSGEHIINYKAWLFPVETGTVCEEISRGYTVPAEIICNQTPLFDVGFDYDDIFSGFGMDEEMQMDDNDLCGVGFSPSRKLAISKVVDEGHMKTNEEIKLNQQNGSSSEESELQEQKGADTSYRQPLWVIDVALVSISLLCALEADMDCAQLVDSVVTSSCVPLRDEMLQMATAHRDALLSSTLTGYEDLSLWLTKPKPKDRRWFSIEGRHLQWHDQPGSSQISGSLDLATIKEIKPVDFGSSTFKFAIVFSDGQLVLGTADESERSKWINALQCQVVLAKEELKMQSSAFDSVDTIGTENGYSEKKSHGLMSLVSRYKSKLSSWQPPSAPSIPSFRASSQAYPRSSRPAAPLIPDAVAASVEINPASNSLLPIPPTQQLVDSASCTGPPAGQTAATDATGQKSTTPPQRVTFGGSVGPHDEKKSGTPGGREGPGDAVKQGTTGRPLSPAPTPGFGARTSYLQKFFDESGTAKLMGLTSAGQGDSKRVSERGAKVQLRGLKQARAAAKRADDEKEKAKETPLAKRDTPAKKAKNAAEAARLKRLPAVASATRLPGLNELTL